MHSEVAVKTGRLEFNQEIPLKVDTVVYVCGPSALTSRKWGKQEKTLKFQEPALLPYRKAKNKII